MKLRYLGLAALSALPWVGAGEPSTEAAPPPSSHLATDTKRGPAPVVAILVGEPLGTTTSLHLVALDDLSRPEPAALGPEVARFAHAEGAAVRAVSGKNGGESSTVLVVADVAREDAPREADLSFAGALFRWRPGEAPTELADRVVHASRPVVARDGAVFVARGEPGVPTQGAMRVDVLWVDEIDPSTGAARTLASLEGHFVYVIAATDTEVLLYRVFPNGADVVAVDRATKKTRAIEKSLPPFARDFSLDPSDKTLVMLDRASDEPVTAGASATWHVVRVDLASLFEKELWQGSAMTIAPFALPGGDVVVSLDAAKGASRLFGAPLPLGQGVVEASGLSESGAWLTGVTRAPGRLGRPFVLDLDRGVARFVDVPLDRRATVAGFVPASAAATAKEAP